MNTSQALLTGAYGQLDKVLPRTPAVVSSAAEAVETYLRSRGIIQGDEDRPGAVRLDGTDLLRSVMIYLTFMSGAYPADFAYPAALLDHTLLMAETERHESGAKIDG